MGGYFMFALPAFGHLIIQPNINVFYNSFLKAVGHRLTTLVEISISKYIFHSL